MKKKLVSADNINDFLTAGAKELEVTPGMILTSSAKDYLRTKGVRLTYGSSAKTGTAPRKSRTCSQDRLKTVVGRIIAILRNDLQVTDPAKVERVTHKVLSTMQKR